MKPHGIFHGFLHPPFIRIGSEAAHPWTQGNLLPEKNPTTSGLEVQGVVPLPLFFSNVKMVRWVGKKQRGEKIHFFWFIPNLKNIQNQDFQRGANSTLRDGELTPFKNRLAPLWRCWYNWIYLEHIVYHFWGNCGWLWGSSWWKLTATCFTGIANYVSLHVWCVWPTFT